MPATAKYVEVLEQENADLHYELANATEKLRLIETAVEESKADTDALVEAVNNEADALADQVCDLLKEKRDFQQSNAELSQKYSDTLRDKKYVEMDYETLVAAYNERITELNNARSVLTQFGDRGNLLISQTLDLIQHVEALMGGAQPRIFGRGVVINSDYNWLDKIDTDIEVLRKSIFDMPVAEA